MRLQPENISVYNGRWGENVAVEHLRRKGYVIVDRNPRPVKKDERLEIDVVAWDKKEDSIVFVEVKQHKRISCVARRLQSVNARKKQNLLRACNAWRRTNKWHVAVRFDVIEIYGVPGEGQPVIDQISDVELFAKPGRFVKWN